MSHRQEKVAEEIRHKMNSAMSKDIMDLNAGIITVSKVILTADLKIAKIYVTFIGNKEPYEKLIEKINLRKKHIRYMLAKHISLKYIPDLIFYYDDTLDEAEKVFRLLNEIKKSDSGKQAD